MKISQAEKIWIDNHGTNSKKNYDQIFPISYEAARIMVERAGSRSVSIYARMICVVMLRRIHQDPVFLLNLSVK